MVAIEEVLDVVVQVPTAVVVVADMVVEEATVVVTLVEEVEDHPIPQVVLGAMEALDSYTSKFLDNGEE